MLELVIYENLSRWNKPVKTRQLAGRLDLEPTEVTNALNILLRKKLVVYTQSRQRSEVKLVGWIAVKPSNKPPLFYFHSFNKGARN